jgi:hypothetical protein
LSHLDAASTNTTSSACKSKEGSSPQLSIATGGCWAAPHDTPSKQKATPGELLQPVPGQVKRVLRALHSNLLLPSVLLYVRAQHCPTSYGLPVKAVNSNMAGILRGTRRPLNNSGLTRDILSSRKSAVAAVAYLCRKRMFSMSGNRSALHAVEARRRCWYCWRRPGRLTLQGAR